MIYRSKPNHWTHFYNFLVCRSNFYESLFQSELLWSSFPAPYRPLCRQELVWVGVLKSVPLSSQFLPNCRRPFYKFSCHSFLEFCQIPHSLFFSLRYLLKNPCSERPLPITTYKLQQHHSYSFASSPQHFSP